MGPESGEGGGVRQKTKKKVTIKEDGRGGSREREEEAGRLEREL